MDDVAFQETTCYRVRLPGPPSQLTHQEIEEAVQVFWPRFNTSEIAGIFGWHESHVANALARVRDRGCI